MQMHITHFSSFLKIALDGDLTYVLNDKHGTNVQ